MRVLFQRNTAKDFIEKASNGKSLKELSIICNVHQRSFSDWKHGKVLMPLHVFEKLIVISSISRPKVKIIPDYWHAKQAGLKGAKERNNLYGNFGTTAGRSKGGIATINKFKTNPQLAKEVGFNLTKSINIPPFSENLAEFIGILLGDGSIANYQVFITLHKKDDFEFSHYVKKLIKNLFNVVPSTYRRDSVTQIIISRKSLVNLLLNYGLLKGNKVKNQIDVPNWIKLDQNFRKKCIRGLFDTDGCFYIDKHKTGAKIYNNCAINFTNRSLPLLKFFREDLIENGLKPTQSSKYSVFLRREKDIINFFELFGSSNKKHINKFKSFFLNKYGEVPKWS